MKLIIQEPHALGDVHAGFGLTDRKDCGGLAQSAPSWADTL